MTKSHSTSGTLIKDSWDVVAGVILLGFALLLLFYLIPNYIGQPPIMQNPMMSPRWLPTIVGAAGGTDGASSTVAANVVGAVGGVAAAC